MRQNTSIKMDAQSAFPFSMVDSQGLNGDVTVLRALGLSKRQLLAGLIAGGLARAGIDLRYVVRDSVALADGILAATDDDSVEYVPTDGAK